MTIMKEKEFNLIINDLINNETVLEMKKYYQHGSTSCFEHCYNVAYVCYKMAKKLRLDYVSATRGAMLHDLFLYDWRTPKKDRVNKKMHAFTHGEIALNNATKLFKINDTEKDIANNTPIINKYINNFYAPVNETQIQQDTKKSSQIRN